MPEEVAILASDFTNNAVRINVGHRKAAVCADVEQKILCMDSRDKEERMFDLLGGVCTYFFSFEFLIL